MNMCCAQVALALGVHVLYFLILVHYSHKVLRTLAKNMLDTSTCRNKESGATSKNDTRMLIKV